MGARTIMLSISLSCLIPVGFRSSPSCSGEIRNTETILEESWRSYVRHFIQKDGRVIDHSAGRISTSEGQAYAMLRAIWMRDRGTFDRTFAWAVNNLNSGIRTDHLWAWKWGRDAGGKWRVLDKAFASDADEDAALALILACRLWNEPQYLNHAQRILADLWRLGTTVAGGRRYLLAGDTLCKNHICRLNPSYYAPYAYRIFSRFDTQRNWNELVNATYYLLDAVSGLTGTRLPPDWVHLDRKTGRLSLASEKDSRFSYDAFRVYWRVAMDRDLFREPRADGYLRKSLTWLAAEWGRKNRLPAVIMRDGEEGARYEALEMVAALMPALQSVNPEIASAMHNKLQASYADGVWGEKDSYYLQNWAWFGTALYSSRLDPFRLR